MSTSTTAQPVARHVGRKDHWQNAVEFLVGAVNVLALLGGISICTHLLDGNWRIAAAVVLTLLGPGSGLVQLVGYFDTAVRISLVVGLSLATSVVVAQVLLTVHGINDESAGIPLTAITGIGTVVGAVRILSREDSE